MPDSITDYYIYERVYNNELKCFVILFFYNIFVELGHIGVVELAGSQAVNGQWAMGDYIEVLKHFKLLNFER